MSRDEETDDPIAVGRHAPIFSVVIAPDGSAVIDGVPVAAVGSEAVDAAILDTLHRHASAAGSPVTAAISDPAVENVTMVEVSPDGSSRLVEQPSEHAVVPPAPVGPGGPAEPAGLTGPYGQPYVDEPLSNDDEFHEGPDDEADDEFDDEEASASPKPSGLASAAPGPLPRRPSTGRTGASRQSDDEFRSSGALHRPLVVGPVALGVAALVIAPLMLLGSGGSGGGQQNEAAGAGDELGASRASHTPVSEPAVSVSPSLLPPPSTASAGGSPQPKPKASHAEGAKPVTATVTVRPPKATATVTAEPAAETAATAVNRLAGNDPGRHICYRAYVAGQGWQKPVCDGTVAGTTGHNRAVKALDIAVRGTGGVAANAFVHSPGSTDGKGVWKPHWTPNAADGEDIYIGSTKKGAPNMLGYAINIGSGDRICQLANVHNDGWEQLGCANPRPDYTFGGTLSNDLWLEAVKFAV